MKHWEFEAEKGKQVIDGKPGWSDDIELTLPRDRALRLIEELARALQYNDPVVSVGLVGRLTSTGDT